MMKNRSNNGMGYDAMAVPSTSATNGTWGRRQPFGSVRSCVKMVPILTAIGLVLLGGTPATASDCILKVADVLGASDVRDGAQFGRSVSIDGTVAVVGASWDSENGEHFGAAYVFGFDGQQWHQEAKLTPSDGRRFLHFGASVAISADVIVVVGGGAVYIFGRDGDTWKEQARLVASDSRRGGRGDVLGSVCVSGDRVAVGNVRARVDGKRRGAVYVYRYDGDWYEEAKLTADDSMKNDDFGFSVAIDDTGIVVGAPGKADNGRNAGGAYVFRFDDSQWWQEALLLGNDTDYRDRFGCDVDILADRILVGAYEQDELRRGNGAAYVFEKNDAKWTEEAKLLGEDVKNGKRFGYSVELENDMALVGQSFPFRKSGAVHLFGYSAQEQNWTRQSLMRVEWFRGAVGLSEDFAIAGAPWAYNAGIQGAGLAHTYAIDCDEPNPCDAIQSFKVGCRNQRLIAKVKSSLEEGSRLTVDNNGEMKVLTIKKRGKGLVKWTNQSGDHDVHIVECPKFQRQTSCN